VNKKRRQQVILELVAAQPVASQEELRQLLEDRGFAVTQSTLSRDLRELRLARIPTPKGARYASPDAMTEDHRTALEDVLPQFFASSDGVGELLVLKTIPGGAQPIAEAIDAQSYPTFSAPSPAEHHSHHLPLHHDSDRLERASSARARRSELTLIVAAVG
jgi:transcriptional regulator of arginine metabolism